MFSLVLPNVSAQVISSDGPAVVYGTTVQLVCVALAGDLPISFIWSYPNGSLISTGSTNDTASTISITPTMKLSYGNYTCTANNTFGSSSDVISIIEAGISA